MLPSVSFRGVRTCNYRIHIDVHTSTTRHEKCHVAITDARERRAKAHIAVFPTCTSMCSFTYLCTLIPNPLLFLEYD